MTLRRLGTVERTAQGLLVVRVRGGDAADGTPDVPGLGTAVVDESLSTVGRVVDVFGPVARPYLAVDPAAGVSPPRLLGDAVYAR